MATIHHASALSTNRYVPDYSHLDKREYQGFTFKEVTSGRVVSHRDRYEEGFTRYLHLITSRPVTRDELTAALHVYARGCACEHDCCGHYHGGAQMYRVRAESKLRDGKARRWLAPVSYSLNY